MTLSACQAPCLACKYKDNVGVHSLGPGVSQPRSCLEPTSYVTLGELFNLSGPHCPYPCEVDDNSAHLGGGAVRSK